MAAHLGVHPSTIYHLQPSTHPSTHPHPRPLHAHTSSTVSSVHPSTLLRLYSLFSPLLFVVCCVLGFLPSWSHASSHRFRHRQSYKARPQRSVAVFAASAACLRSFRHKFRPNPSRFEWVEVILGQRSVYREARTGSSFVIAGVFNSLFYFIRRPWCLYLHTCLLLPLVCICIPPHLSLALSLPLFTCCAAAACGSARWWYDWARGCRRLTGYVSSGSRRREFSCLFLIGVRERCLF